MTYLDDDIMIARDDTGAPDLLIRKEKVRWKALRTKKKWILGAHSYWDLMCIRSNLGMFLVEFRSLYAGPPLPGSRVSQNSWVGPGFLHARSRASVIRDPLGRVTC